MLFLIKLKYKIGQFLPNVKIHVLIQEYDEISNMVSIIIVVINIILCDLKIKKKRIETFIYGV